MPKSYVEQYALDDEFKDVYATLCQGKQVEELDHVHDQIFCHLGKISIPRDERVNIIREAHTSLIISHFGVGKTME